VDRLVALLKANGLEVLSLETRHLDVREAMFMRVRSLQAQDEGMVALVTAGFDQDAGRRATEIRGAGSGAGAFAAAAAGDLEGLLALAQAAKDLEQSIRR